MKGINACKIFTDLLMKLTILEVAHMMEAVVRTVTKTLPNTVEKDWGNEGDNHDEKLCDLEG